MYVRVGDICMWTVYLKNRLKNYNNHNFKLKKRMVQKSVILEDIVVIKVHDTKLMYFRTTLYLYIFDKSVNL